MSLALAMLGSAVLYEPDTWIIEPVEKKRRHPSHLILERPVLSEMRVRILGQQLF